MRLLVRFIDADERCDAAAAVGDRGQRHPHHDAADPHRFEGIPGMTELLERVFGVEREATGGSCLPPPTGSRPR